MPDELLRSDHDMYKDHDLYDSNAPCWFTMHIQKPFKLPSCYNDEHLLRCNQLMENNEPGPAMANGTKMLQTQQ